MRRPFLLIAVVAAIFISGCGKSDAQKENELNANLKMLGERYVKAKLKDPDSAEFRNQFIGKAGAPCGEVNSKNSFGGFVGFQRYISVGTELTVLKADMPAGDFDTTWTKMCR
ncbi:hypothetical protein QN362_00355 [Actimicrobium sp. CCC2.4]|uniref:hypothetical protein n=1 Tax=Actimicrobium sp. CCC2.4 TaxID=3048606 RepID=UPI002AC97400|nr:hypothetical protein [Actimicrobium sp. CCC2.4]MEB0133776.1 hypothetical protein [Actimicrobium sp. CCC2.4]WPX31319.1 hypothetical protein RHM62_13835 [Actimicrobium sp. CCC2.4]